MEFKERCDMAVRFHGHRCPAMPMGLRAGLAAMKALGVQRARDKELRVISDTGKGHAAGCFLDGLMVATGCTYGKSNIEKRYWNKMAFNRVDTRKGRAPGGARCCGPCRRLPRGRARQPGGWPGLHSGGAARG